MDTRNCYEPIINEKEKVIEAFVEEALNSYQYNINESAKGAPHERMVELEQEEYLNSVKILSEVYYKCPPMKHIKDARNKSDFIWDSLFFEDIGKENVEKWFRNPLNADINTFKEDNTIYDEDHPYFSYIYKVLLYERYVEFLLDDQKKHKTLIEIDKNKKKWERKKSEADAFIADMEQKLAERKAQTKNEKRVTAITPPVTPPEAPSCLPTFEHNLTDSQMSHLACIINEQHIFYEDNITAQQLKSIFNCSPTVILKSKNNRLLAYLFDQLSRQKHIVEDWQVVIAKNNLFKSSGDEHFLNQNDLSSAINNVLESMDKTEKYIKIKTSIEDLKNH